MSQFVSWIEDGQDIFYLTGKQIFNTTRGKMLMQYTQSADDYVGHGAIRWFYDLPGYVGENRQHTDFKRPQFIPARILRSIKNCGMKGMVILPELLNEQGLSEYRQKVTCLQGLQGGPLYAPSRQEIFWSIFSVPTNRIEIWR